jgi:hypothetical protein
MNEATPYGKKENIVGIFLAKLKEAIPSGEKTRRGYTG